MKDQIQIIARYGGKEEVYEPADHIVERVLNILQTPVMVPLHSRLDALVKIVCEYFGITHEIFTSRSRKRDYVFARYMFYFLGRKHTSCMHRVLACKTGGRDHTTVSHGIASMQNWIDTDETVRKQIEDLETLIMGV